MDQRSIEGAIAHVIADLADAWNTHDVATFAAQFRPDAEFTDVVGQTACGHVAIAEQHTVPFARLFRQARFVVTDHAVKVLAPAVASVDCRWTMTGHTSPAGEPLPPRRGLLHLVLVEERGRWWPVVSHNVDHTATYRRADLPV